MVFSANSEFMFSMYDVLLNGIQIVAFMGSLPDSDSVNACMRGSEWAEDGGDERRYL